MMGCKDLIIVFFVGVFFISVNSERMGNKNPDLSETKSLHEEGMRVVQRIYDILETITNMERNKDAEEERNRGITQYNAKIRRGGDFKSQAWRKKRSTFGKNLMDITFLQQLESDTAKLKTDVREFLERLRQIRDSFQRLRLYSNKSNVKLDNANDLEFIIKQAEKDNLFGQ